MNVYRVLSKLRRPVEKLELNLVRTVGQTLDPVTRLRDEKLLTRFRTENLNPLFFNWVEFTPSNFVCTDY